MQTDLGVLHDLQVRGVHAAVYGEAVIPRHAAGLG